jgi:hypothetical protein
MFLKHTDVVCCNDIMKKICSLGLGLMSWVCLAGASARATVVGLGTIEQPVNLCAAADPSRIPLGPVVIESNYGYGTHAVIVEPRPCLRGAMTWKGGLELNQNLASAFGISLEIEDDTQIHEGIVRLVLRNQARPAYSPYQRQQVVAATVHCLLRSVHATPKSPLRVQIVSQNASDQDWIKTFPGEYVNRPDREGDVIEFTEIPGTKIEVDVYGVAHVVFPQVKMVPSVTPMKPIMIPVSLAGGDADDARIVILPQWVGDTVISPLEAIAQPYSLFYDRFNSATPTLNQVNFLQQGREPLQWRIHESATVTHLTCYFSEQSHEVISAGLYAAILSAQPTEEKPMIVTMYSLGDAKKLFAPFLKDGSWVLHKERDQEYIETIFVIGKNGVLMRGVLPDILLEKTASGSYMLTYTGDEKAYVEPAQEAEIMDSPPLPSEFKKTDERTTPFTSDVPISPFDQNQPNPLLDIFLKPVIE